MLRWNTNDAHRKGLRKAVIVKKIYNLQMHRYIICKCTAKVFGKFVRQRVLSDLRRSRADLSGRRARVASSAKGCMEPSWGLLYTALSWPWSSEDTREPAEPTRTRRWVMWGGGGREGGGGGGGGGGGKGESGGGGGGPEGWGGYGSAHGYADNTRKPVCSSEQHTKLIRGGGGDSGYADSSQEPA